MLGQIPEKLARITAGLSAFASLAWLLWPGTDWKLEPEAAIAFSSMLLTWTTLEVWALFPQAAHPHDVKFIRAFNRAIPLFAVRYLQQHDFGTTYDNSRLEMFWKVDSEAETSGYGPHDRRLAKKFEAFRKKLRDLNILLASNGGPVNPDARLASIVPEKERVADHFSDDTMKLIKKVNDTATEVIRLHAILMKDARNRAPEAFSDR